MPIICPFDAPTGDSVVVAAGTYTGAGNKNLNLKGKPLVLRSDDGAAVTIIVNGTNEFLHNETMQINP